MLSEVKWLVRNASFVTEIDLIILIRISICNIYGLLCHAKWQIPKLPTCCSFVFTLYFLYLLDPFLMFITDLQHLFLQWSGLWNSMKNHRLSVNKSSGTTLLYSKSRTVHLHQHEDSWQIKPMKRNGHTSGWWFWRQPPGLNC